ncbi:MAG: hypothetical protein Kow00124_06990 [Anaerolineae bacterium]
MPNQPVHGDWQEPTQLHEPVPETAVHEGVAPDAPATILGLSPRLLLAGGVGLLGLLAVMILVFVLFLPPFNLAAGLFGGGFEALGAERPSVSHPDGLTVTHLGGERMRVKLDAFPREAFLAGDVRGFEGARAALPPYLEMKSPLFTIQRQGEGAASIAVTIPADAQTYETLDLYTWDAQSGEWVFVPGHIDPAGEIVVSDVLPENLALFQTRQVTPLIGTLLEPGQVFDETGAAPLNLVMPTGIRLEDNGLLGGAPVGGWQLGAGYAVVPVITSTNSEALSQLLNNDASRALHVSDIQSFVVNDGYHGVAIDYQGVTPADRAVFARFITDLGASLDQQNKLLVVVVPRPVGGGMAWDTGAYDWRAIGAAADIVVINAGDMPADYSINGPVLSMLGWAVGEISRVKLQVMMPTASFDETAGAAISYEDGVSAFNTIALQTQPPAEGAAFEPGAELTFTLPGVSDVVADQNTGAYVFTANGDAGARRIWLVTASTIRARLDMAARYRIGGAVLKGLLSPGHDPALLTAVNEFKAQNISSVPSQVQVSWSVNGSGGPVMTENTGIGTPFVWQAGQPGQYQVAAAIVGGGAYDRGSVAVQVGTQETPPAETATPAPTARPQTTQTPAPTQQATPTTTAPPPAGNAGADGSGLELGGQVMLGTVPPADVMRSAGMTWVKYQIKWEPGLSPSVAGDFINIAHGQGFKILLSIPGQLYPTSIDFAGYVEFLRGVAAYRPDAIEVWNEMNLYNEWPEGQIDPASYVNNMLAPAFNAIKSVSPNTMVIIGALAPTGVNNSRAMSDDRYVAGMAAAGAARYANCIGVHHNSGTTSPSVRSGRPEGDHYSWYFLPTLEVYYYGMGGALPVCLTEYGYLTGEGIGPLPEAFIWGSTNTVANQAAWLGEGVQIARSLGWVRMVIIWNVGFTTWGADPQAGYSIIRPDGSCPACATLRTAMQ